jgi:Holliday junction resolvase RusA-like endonuclease
MKTRCEWSFFFPGPPVGQGRPRFAKCGRITRVYTPHRTSTWQSYAASIVGHQYRGEALDCPVSVAICAVLARPQRLMRACDPTYRIGCVTKPDVDNVAKIVLDALVRGGCIKDDAQ